MLIVQDLWQVHYQMLFVIFQKEFIKINVKIVTAFSIKKGQGKFDKI